MSRGINKVIIVGNVGADPEIRYMASGDPVANLSIATSESWRDKQSGQLQERTEWHRIVMYGKTAEIVQKYVRKGTKLFIEGALRTRKWQDKNGQDRYTTEIICDALQMLDSKGSANGDQRNHSNDYQSAPAEQSSYSSYSESHHSLAATDLEDELPF